MANKRPVSLLGETLRWPSIRMDHRGDREEVESLALREGEKGRMTTESNKEFQGDFPL